LTYVKEELAIYRNTLLSDISSLKITNFTTLFISLNSIQCKYISNELKTRTSNSIECCGNHVTSASNNEKCDGNNCFSDCSATSSGTTTSIGLSMMIYLFILIKIMY